MTLLAPANGLTYATENLYAVFGRYPARHPVEGCPHCVSDEDKACLQSAPLRLLSASSLDRYNYKAITTWGDVDDFRHFLPRLLELVAQNDGIDFLFLGYKLKHGKWHTWPDDERQAVHRYLLALWRNLLSIDASGLTIGEFLDVAAHIATTDRFLDVWEEEASSSAIRHLAEYAQRHGDHLLSVMNSRRSLHADERKVLAFLRQPWVRERLEAAFFAPPAGCEAVEFSQAVAPLDWRDYVLMGRSDDNSTGRANVAGDS